MLCHFWYTVLQHVEGEYEVCDFDPGNPASPARAEGAYEIPDFKPEQPVPLNVVSYT